MMYILFVSESVDHKMHHNEHPAMIVSFSLCLISILLHKLESYSLGTCCVILEYIFFSFIFIYFSDGL